jgi:membrane protein
METVRGRPGDRSPADITSRGWKEIAVAVWRNITEHRILELGAGSAFYLVLAISPTVAAGVSLFGLFADPGHVRDFVDQLTDVVPSGVLAILRSQLQTLVERAHGALGATLTFSMALSLWSANRATKALIDALNVIYGEREWRGFVRLNLASLALALGAMTFGFVAVAATVAVPLALRSTAFGEAPELLLRLGRWPLLLAISTLALALLYYLAPAREVPRWRWVTAGSAAASVLWLMSSLLFSAYVMHFAHYDRTYGSLAGIVVLMLWLWLSTVVVLLGAEIDAEMEEHAGERPSNRSDQAGLPTRTQKHEGRLGHGATGPKLSD